MRYLFWNTNKKEVDSVIFDMAKKYKPTIIALAEYAGDVQNLVEKLQLQVGINYKVVEKLACRVKILINEKISDGIEHCHDHTNYTIKILPYNSYVDKYIVAFVHLPSKMQDNREKNRFLLERITKQIDVQSKEKNRKVLIFGDFNLNPYEDAMIQLTGCNAVSSKDVAMKIGRKGWGEEGDRFLYYYNPMWNFLGDANSICGTYYYDKTSDHSRYWNTFDQFVVSPELIKDIDDIEIIKEVGKIKLADEKGVPKISDHYPLYFKLGGK